MVFACDDGTLNLRCNNQAGCYCVYVDVGRHLGYTLRIGDVLGNNVFLPSITMCYSTDFLDYRMLFYYLCCIHTLLSLSACLILTGWFS